MRADSSPGMITFSVTNGSIPLTDEDEGSSRPPAPKQALARTPAKTSIRMTSPLRANMMRNPQND